MIKGFYSKKIVFSLVIVIFVAFIYQYAVSSKYRLSSEKAKEMIKDKKVEIYSSMLEQILNVILWDIIQVQYIFKVLTWKREC